MKRLLLILLIPFIINAQTGKSNLTQNQIKAIQAMIDASGGSSGDFVDKTSAQTITGQKNFSGTVKFRSDSSITVGGTLGYPLGLSFDLRTVNSYQIPLKFNVLDANTAAWTLTSGEVDFTPSLTGKDHVFNIGYNWNSLLQKPQFGQQMEANYEQNDTTIWYEWFSYYNNLPSPNTTYQTRPFQIATVRYGSSAPYRYSSSAVFNVDVLSILDETNASLIEFRTQTYGATPTAMQKNNAGEYSNALGNSVMMIMDSLWISHLINNFGWLYQADTVGSAKELMRIDNNDRVVIAPGNNADIELRTPIYGQIKWRNEANNGTIPIYKEDGTDRIYIGGADGMITNKLVITNIPQDTIGLNSNEFYIDANTGSVQYTLPENLVTNGDFTDWTGILKQQLPDHYISTLDTLHSYVEQVPTGSLHYIDDGTTDQQFHHEGKPTAGVTYGYSYTISQASGTTLVYAGADPKLITQAGYYSGVFTPNDNSYYWLTILRGDAGNACSITMDDLKVWEIGGTTQAPPFELSKLLSGLDSFTTTATEDTISNASITSDDVFMVSINDATPVADDLLSWTVETGRLIVHRPAGTTSNLAYSYMRIK